MIALFALGAVFFDFSGDKMLSISGGRGLPEEIGHICTLEESALVSRFCVAQPRHTEEVPPLRHGIKKPRISVTAQLHGEAHSIGRDLLERRSKKPLGVTAPFKFRLSTRPHRVGDDRVGV
jgi:hypothetical protein